MKILIALLFMLSSLQVFAGGFEKANGASGRYAPLMSAVSSVVEGAESLMLNPAGLAWKKGQQVAVTFSPTLAQFKAPIIPVGQAEGEKKLLPIFSAYYSYSPSDKLGFGLGSYVSGGASNEYKDLQMGTAPYKPTLKTDLNIIEVAGGVGYEVVKGFKIGGAVRAAFVNADYYSSTYIPAAAAAPFGGQDTVIDNRLDGLTDTQTAFRLGAQYEHSSKKWGVGFTYRSAIDFTAEGDVSGTISNAAISTIQFTGSSATAKSSLPEAFAIDGHYNVNEKLTVLAGYYVAKYSDNKQLDLTGTLTGTGAVTGYNIDLANNPVIFKWDDQEYYKLASEYRPNDKCAHRFGFSYGSAVTNAMYARPGLTPPDTVYAVTYGHGKKDLFQNLDLDMGLEYTWGKADVTAADKNATGIPSGAEAITGYNTGEYSVWSLALHLGVTYNF